MTEGAPRQLSGKRIVVVEDDYILGEDLCDSLRELGATVLGPAPTPYYAMQLFGHRRVDAAVLDIRLHGDDAYELADTVREKGVPIIFATGRSPEELPERFRDVPFLAKPIDLRRLVSTVTESVTLPPRVVEGPLQSSGAATTRPSPVHSFARALARRL